MPHHEEKIENVAPKVNFIWVGSIKEGCFNGPKSLAVAKNDAGQSYPITCFVEEEQVAAAKAEVSAHANIQVKSTREVIRTYCKGDLEKERRVDALLLQCKTGELPTVSKEILSAMLQSTASGYYLDTTISATEITNLPNLTQPALPRNLIPAIDSKNSDLLHHKFWQYEQYKQHKQYKALKNNLRVVKKSQNVTSSDLYVYFSAGDSTGKITPESKNLFFRLAEYTIRNWESFFKENFASHGTDSFSERVNHAMTYMINHVLLGAVNHVYLPHEREDDETLVELDKQKNTLTIYDVATGEPRNLAETCGFTTIDCIVGQNITSKETGLCTTQLKLFCAGKLSGITKYINASWKNNNFKPYLERKLHETDAALEAESASRAPRA